jgi:L-lysine 6-transaminase
VFDLAGEIANDIETEEARADTEIQAAFAAHPGRVAAIIIEPMQGEGGDNHFRAEFLAQLRRYADEQEAMLIFDEVQTGFYGSGRAWWWQHLGVSPDIVAFGKKTQICGIYASPRVDEVADNVFSLPSRINSTWGGNLADMVRCRRFIQIIEEDHLAEHVTAMGDRLLAGLRDIARRTGGFTNVRGRGSLVAITLETAEQRQRLLEETFARELILLPCGPRSVRFRLPFVITPAEIDDILNRVEASLPPKG